MIAIIAYIKIDYVYTYILPQIYPAHLSTPTPMHLYHETTQDQKHFKVHYTPVKPYNTSKDLLELYGSYCPGNN